MNNLNNRKAPILIIGYNRPEFIERRLLSCYELRNREIHLSLDFHSLSTTNKFKEIIRRHQANIEKYNFFTVNYQNRNLGLAQHITSSISGVLSLNEKIIVIEDDINFNTSSIENLDFGLRHMDLNPCLASVGMFSPIQFNNVKSPINIFRYSKYFACWGWGTSKNVWENYVLDISNEKIDEILSNSLLFNKLSQQQQETWLGRFNKLKSNTFHTWDLQFQLMSFRSNLEHMLPLVSISNNEGFADERSVHTKGDKPKWMRLGHLPTCRITKISESNGIKTLMEKIECYTLVGDKKIRTFFG